MSIVDNAFASVTDRVATFPLQAALIGRRSRRFAKGAVLDGGPLTYRSETAPEPLTMAEESALAFAAAGVTGHALADMQFGSGAIPESGNGNIVVHLLGRTVPSGDALHSVMLFVVNDEGTWLVRRPQDFTPAEIATLVSAAREGRFVDLYQASRVRIAPRRATIENRVPLVGPFNMWDANVPGSTYFIPVSELTALYINVLLTAFSDEMGLYILDDRARFRPAGLRAFARSRGGHLHDDPAAGRVLTVSYLETTLSAMAAVEEGAMHQSLALMAEALGLGGFTHAAAAPQWLPALGFETASVRFSKAYGLGFIVRLIMKLLGAADPPIDHATGLRRDARQDTWLVRPFAPPHYPNMRSAVRAFVDYKFHSDDGTLTGNGPSAWRDAATIKRGIPRYSAAAIEATAAYCDYLYQRYGRFPATIAPVRTLLAYQAHHLEPGFYQRFYTADALGDRHEHQHGPGAR